MQDPELDDLAAVLPPLLRALETLGHVARHLNPGAFEALIDSVGTPDEALRTVLPRLEAWPARLDGVKAPLEIAAEAALAAFDNLRAAGGQAGALRGAYRALRQLARAQEALYPLAAALPPVSRYFLDPAMRQDPGRLARLAQAAPREDVGVFHVDGEAGARGGFSLYVPEDYTSGRAWPLVMALHGGAGDGRGFLWTWLRDARARGAILVCPTAIGDTWALMDADADTPNLARILGEVSERWRIDPARRLLTGMSDGGTFCYVSGLEPASPFTHLAPVAASFHPVLAQMADAGRMAGLPIFLTHGALDWMFPVSVAREAEEALSAAGARVTYLELPDLGHCYPREVNPHLLDWLATTDPIVR